MVAGVRRDQARDVTRSFWEPGSLDELAARQGAGPLRSVEDLAADIWASPEELDEFLADIYAARASDLNG